MRALCLAALLAATAFLFSCGGGGAPAPSNSNRPLDVELAKCEPWAFGGVEALAADGQAGIVWVAGTMQGCDGAPANTRVLFRIDSEGHARRIPGEWEHTCDGVFGCFGQLGLAVDGAGVLHMISEGFGGRIPSIAYRVDRDGNFLDKQTLGVALWPALGIRMDGTGVAYGSDLQSTAETLFEIKPSGETMPTLVTALRPEGTQIIDALFGGVRGIAVDSNNNTYVGATTRIHRLSRDGVLDYRWLGSGQDGFGFLGQPAMDTAGNLYVTAAGSNSSAACVIRRISASGVTSVVAAPLVLCVPGSGGLLAFNGQRLVMAARGSWRVVSTPL